jgi:hypothetical protein
MKGFYVLHHSVLLGVCTGILLGWLVGNMAEQTLCRISCIVRPCRLCHTARSICMARVEEFFITMNAAKQQQSPPSDAMVKLTCPTCGMIRYWTRADIERMTRIVEARGERDIVLRHQRCKTRMHVALLEIVQGRTDEHA